MNRRHILKSSGIGIALPFFESTGFVAAAAAANSPPLKRFVAIGSYLGFHTPSWFPETPGRDYEISPVLSPLESFRDDFTLFSGLDHRALNGHKYWRNYLTGTSAASESLDQMIARHIGGETRFASLQITCGQPAAMSMMSFTREGIFLPAIGRPSALFATLFSSDSDRARMAYMLDSGRSVLDLALAEAKALQARVNRRDREKLDEFFTSLREVEKDVQKQRRWLDKPAPEVDYQLPEVDPVAPDLSLECESVMYDLIALALETDSTRVIGFLLPGRGQVFTIDGERLSAGYHGLSHHGQDPSKIADFNRIGIEHTSRFAKFLGRLKGIKDVENRSLLDTTAVLYGSGMGDASTHNNSRLPILLAGGPFKHGAYHAIDRDNETDATPLLGDLFITIMQSLGMEVDTFVKARRNMNDYLL